MIQIPLNKVLPSGAFSIATFDNKSYVVPAWIEVPNGTSFSDIEITGKPEYKEPAEVKEYTVTGSTGKSYTVTIDSRGLASCDCAGFSFRRACRHTKQIPA